VHFAVGDYLPGHRCKQSNFMILLLLRKSPFPVPALSPSSASIFDLLFPFSSSRAAVPFQHFSSRIHLLSEHRITSVIAVRGLECSNWSNYNLPLSFVQLATRSVRQAEFQHQ